MVSEIEYYLEISSGFFRTGIYRRATSHSIINQNLQSWQAQECCLPTNKEGWKSLLWSRNKANIQLDILQRWLPNKLIKNANKISLEEFSFPLSLSLSRVSHGNKPFFFFIFITSPARLFLSDGVVPNDDIRVPDLGQQHLDQSSWNEYATCCRITNQPNDSHAHLWNPETKPLVYSLLPQCTFFPANYPKTKSFDWFQ